jgi:DNA-binding winged helix-turn-helix (wHTH) protein
MEIAFGACVLDLAARRFYRDAREVHLTPKAFELLKLLLEQRPRALSKAELVERIWPGIYVTEDGLPRLVNEIRTAIGDNPREPRWLRTVHRFGYAFADGTDTSAARTLARLTWGSREFRLAAGDSVIGRDPDAHVSIDDPMVSRRHARIVIDGDRAALEDLGSKNGTFVGASRITGRHTLRDGDQIGIAELTLTFHAARPLATETVHGR